MKGFLALATALIIATPAWAAHWSVDYAKSKLGFTVSWSKEPFTATFKSWKADIDFDPADLSHAHTDVSIDLASEASDESDFDDGLKGAQGFETTRFPMARFVTSGFTHKSGDAYVATGRLSLHGAAKDITLPFTLTLDGAHAHMKGTAEVMRAEFAIGQGMWAAPSSPVAQNVTVTIDLYATRS